MYLNVPFLLTQGECVENIVENNVESLLRIRWVFHVVTSTTNIEFTHTYMNVHLVFILFICINIVVKNITTGCCIMYRGVHRVVCYRVTPCKKHKYKYCGIHIARFQCAGPNLGLPRVRIHPLSHFAWQKSRQNAENMKSLRFIFYGP